MFIQKSYQNNIGIGSLFLVGTPIGNLNDITYRAIQTLQEVDLIAAEDTRHTLKLLNHFKIQKRLISYHEHNKEASGNGIIEMLLDGTKIAIVSDAGLPAISDPGFELVKEAIKNDIPVIPIPGPNAGITGLIASGLDTNRFIFIGFLSRKKKSIVDELMEIKYYKETMIFYEAPHRIKKTLNIMLEILGDRQVVLIRELTKKHEEFIRGSIKEVIIHLGEDLVKGELTLIIEGSNEVKEEEIEAWWYNTTILEHVQEYISKGIPQKEAMKRTSVDRNIPKKQVYKEYHQI